MAEGRDDIKGTHWIGEVVDNADPSNLGRCRVKVFGKFDDLPDDSIPWATPMNRDFVGMHPQLRQMPPRDSRSITPVFNPSCAARMAAT